MEFVGNDHGRGEQSAGAAVFLQTATWTGAGDFALCDAIRKCDLFHFTTNGEENLSVQNIREGSSSDDPKTD